MAMPLVFVVSLSMLKDAYEDYKRHAQDMRDNDESTEVYDRGLNRFVPV